jgi:anti-anti-sigma factor
LPAHARAAAVREDVCPVRWAGQQAVVTLPEHIDVSNAGQIREELLSVINRGAASLITGMTATISCDHAGADAVVRAYQRAVASGTELRLVVTAPIVRRVLSLNGLDRLVSIYPSLEAAMAARAPTAARALAATSAETGTGGHAPPRRAERARVPLQSAAGSSDRPAAAVTPAVLWRLVDAFHDGVALADSDGTIVLANRRLEEMFGYEHAELDGSPVERLIPADLQAIHRSHRAAYAQAPTARPMGAGARLVGLRKDGATVPVEISLSPVPTATGHLTLTVIRDVTETRRLPDLADLARATATAEQAHRGQELLDRISASLSQIGLSLRAAMDLPADVVRQRIAEALEHIDDTIREIRDTALTTRDLETPPHPAPSNGPG